MKSHFTWKNYVPHPKIYRDIPTETLNFLLSVAQCLPKTFLVKHKIWTMRTEINQPGEKNSVPPLKPCFTQNERFTEYPEIFLKIAKTKDDGPKQEILDAISQECTLDGLLRSQAAPARPSAPVGPRTSYLRIAH